MLTKLVVSLSVSLILISSISAQQGNISFQGTRYNSISEVIAASSSGNGSSEPLGCGPAASRADVERGYYDETTRWVCHSGHKANNVQFRRNQSLRARFLTPEAASVLAPPDFYSSHYKCSDPNRGTPFHNPFYNGAMDDVCASNLRENLSARDRVKSYWQAGHGRTYFYYRYYPGMFWWLDAPTASTPATMGRAMKFYHWCEIYYDGRCH